MLRFIRSTHIGISLKSFLLIACGSILLSTNIFAATKAWTGLANDGNWASSANWNNNTVPNASDDVVLDNSLKSGDYIVVLPNTAVTIRTVTIAPAANNIIQLVLPATNILAPGFTAIGPGYGLTINNGGVFKNSSGAPNMVTVAIADSIRINNGGKFIHNTQRSHTANVSVLSKMPGTENGIFEFDVPGTQGYTVSISNRIYGTLVLSANAAPGGIKTYTGSGSNALTINGDFQIGVGVTFKCDLATTKGNINLNGSFVQYGGTFNMASGPDSSILKIKGDIMQSAGSVITESSTGIPAIELDGLAQQNISMHGTISDSILFRMNNAAGAVLQAALALPYKLDLVKGNITTTSVNLLTLQTGCIISADSTNATRGFINGPLRKEGLTAADYFLFPVGKANEFRWLELKNATGNFTVEFISGDARSLSSSYAAGINHISSHGYWAINADASPAASAKVELSFADASVSGVTDMATLRASELSANIWIDRNNTATTGTPGASGSVVSEAIAGISPTASIFVLASSVGNENPLPVILTDFNTTKMNGHNILKWEIASPANVEYFEILSGNESNGLKIIGKVMATATDAKYSFVAEQNISGTQYYQLRITEKNGNTVLSKIIAVDNAAGDISLISVSPAVVTDYARFIIHSTGRSRLQLVISGMNGKIIRRILYDAGSGRDILPVNVSDIPAGIYLAKILNDKGQTAIVRFIKE